MTKGRFRSSSNVAAYFLGLSVLLTLFFGLWRLILLGLTWTMAESVPGSVLVGAFITGLRFDFSIAAYLTIPLALLGMLPFIDISRNKIMRWVNIGLLHLLVAVTFFLHIGDIEFFTFFNARLSGVALLWSESPDYMAKLVWETYPVVRYFMLWGLMLAAFIFLAGKLRRWQLQNYSPSKVWVNTLWLLIILIIMGVGARGRVSGRSPLRWGVAYFSEFSYANLLALNPTHTFARDALYDAGSKTHLKELMRSIDNPQADSITRHLLGLPNHNSGRIGRKVTPENRNPKRPNVVLVIMESFGATRIGSMDNRWPYQLTPNFDSLANEGLLFDNVYSGGMHTYGGLYSTCYGYPHMFGDLAMKLVTGQYFLWGLPQILGAHNYQTQFYTTHDPHFDNMQGFFMANGVDRVYSIDDYGLGVETSVTGVPDHVMFDFAADRFAEMADQPFCSILLTGSNHGPWFLPEVPYGEIDPDDPDAYFLNAFKYADWSLGRFVRKLKSNPDLASNTLVVITSDNGLPYAPECDVPMTQYHIPLLMIWLGEEQNHPARINTLGSQLDIIATVMGQVNLAYDNYTFGRDLLDTLSNITRFAHFSEWYKQGYIEGDYYCVTRIGAPNSLYPLSDLTRDISDSLPELTRELSNKSLALYQTAYHNLRRKLKLETGPAVTDENSPPTDQAAAVPEK